MESGVDIHVEELDGLLARWRRATVEVAGKGVPPHITLLYPWKPPPIEASDIHDLEDALAEVRPFNLTFSEIRSFPNGTIYLGLEDEGAPRRLTAVLSEAFPEFPPYGGQIPDPTPHLTIANVEPHRLEDARAEIDEALRDRLPIHTVVDEIVVMVENGDGWWTVRHRHRLGSPPPS